MVAHTFTFLCITPDAGTEGQQEVIKGLSALRSFLKKEQRQLEQLGLVETNHSHLSRYISDIVLGGRGFSAQNIHSVISDLGLVAQYILKTPL